MLESERRKAIAGLVAWLAVAVLALVAVEMWDPFWGFFPVAAAVIAAWAIGEWATRRGVRDATE